MLTRLSGATYRTTMVTLVWLLAASSGWAQNRYDGDPRNYDRNALQRGSLYVTVYEDCDFRGRSRSLTVGDYKNVRDLDLRNDEISSVEVPEGLELVLHEHEDFRGDSTLITSDVRCLNRIWDNQTSSLRVREDPKFFSTRSRTNPRLESDNRPQAVERFGNPRRGPATEVSYVEFASSALERKNNGHWQIKNKNGSLDRFRELSRDRNSITLEHVRIDQQVRIDLAANRVRFFAPNGNQVDYVISATDNRASNRQATQNRVSGIISNSCFNYRAYTRGGQGGVRFHGHEGFHRFDKKAHSGRICHDGPLTMEINKNRKSTDVLIDINGETYRFAPNEQEDVLLNTWYRKKVRLQVGG